MRIERKVRWKDRETLKGIIKEIKRELEVMGRNIEKGELWELGFSMDHILRQFNLMFEYRVDGKQVTLAEYIALAF